MSRIARRTEADKAAQRSRARARSAARRGLLTITQQTALMWKAADGQRRRADA